MVELNISQRTVTISALMFSLLGFNVCSSCQAESHQTKTGPAGRSPRVIAHRGGRVWAPENTLAAFRKSLDAGVYGIELDVHRCKSGELVVIHDEDIRRTTDGAGMIKDMTYDDLKKFSAGVKFGEGKEFASERVPLLKEVLTLIDGKIEINVEIKNTPVRYAGIEDELARELSSYKAPEKIIVSSFDHASLNRFHRRAPQFRTALLGDCVIYDLKTYAKNFDASAFNAEFGGFRKDCVATAHEAGLEVNVWTVNKPEDFAEAMSWQVDGIITDDPPALIKFLAGQKNDLKR